MDLQPYVDGVRIELEIAAAAGGAEAAELAERLSAPLDSALRLALLEALSEAAQHITRELAPASVDVRLRGRDPEFVVTGTSADADPEPPVAADADLADGAFSAPTGDDGGTWRVTLRLPEALRGGVDAAARRDGLSVNAWLVRAVGAALGPAPRERKRGNAISGWVR